MLTKEDCAQYQKLLERRCQLAAKKIKILSPKDRKETNAEYERIVTAMRALMGSSR